MAGWDFHRMRGMCYVHFALRLPRTALFFLKKVSCAGEATKSFFYHCWDVFLNSSSFFLEKVKIT